MSVRVIASGCLALSMLLSGCDEAGTRVGTLALADPAGAAKDAPDREAIIKRGEYLVTVAACSDCHTPLKMGPNGPEPDMTRYMSGHPQGLTLPPTPPPPQPWIGYLSSTNTAFAGPWGVTYAANLTPDRQTGLGIWTEQMFITAIREGKHMGVARPILPPMPWQQYGRMTDEDLRAIFAYLQSLPPIVNEVPEHEPPGGREKHDYE